jgi:hypothetical protein
MLSLRKPVLVHQPQQAGAFILYECNVVIKCREVTAEWKYGFWERAQAVR